LIPAVPEVPPETPYDHVANGAQLLLAAEAALDRLGMIGNGDDDATEVRETIRGAQARLLKALFLLSASA